MEKTYKEKYEKAKEQLTSRNKFFKKKALKYQASVTRCVRLEDELLIVSTQLRNLREVHVDTEVRANRWIACKHIYKSLLEAELEKFEFSGE